MFKISERTILILAILFSICFISLLWFLNQKNKTIVSILPKVIACTMEAKICPDGSTVGRNGPNCEFPPCPTITFTDLLIYQNTQYNYEFKYPSSWKYNSLTDDSIVEITSPKRNVLYVRVNSDISKKISDYLSKIDKQSSTAYEGTPSVTVMSTKKTIINGLNYIQRQENYNAAGFSVYSTYFKNGNNLYVLTLQPQEGTIHPDDIAAYQQILSTFKFTESKAENNFKLGNSNFYLNFPSDSIINKNIVTIDNNVFNINTFIGSGLCPMDEAEAAVESCTYTDQPGSKWGTYRIWTKNSKPFAINPQSIILNDKYFDGMIVTKLKPNEFFTQYELSQWGDILNKISYTEQKI